MPSKRRRNSPSLSGQIKLTGRIYDVRELDSVAILLVDEPSLRGLYRLGFADGGAYAGQSINVVSRFTSHRKKWEDIVTFEFFPIPVGDLNGLERMLITETETVAPGRNIRDTKRPHGEGDLEFITSEGISTFLPWDRAKRIRPGQNITGKDAKKFTEIARLNEYEVLRDLIGWFIYETLPDPYNTQRHLWIASCLPATNHSRTHQRLLALSAGNLEIFVVFQDIVDGTAETELFINTNTVEVNLSSLQDPEGRWIVEHTSYSLSDVTCWRFTVDTFEDVLNGTIPFPHLKLLLENSYQLNVRLMRQGGTMFGRFHNELLARDLLAASLKWDNDDWRTAVQLGDADNI